MILESCTRCRRGMTLGSDSDFFWPPVVHQLMEVAEEGGSEGFSLQPACQDVSLLVGHVPVEVHGVPRDAILAQYFT